MERRAKCRICDEVIEFTDVGSLGHHLITKHPNCSPSYYTVSPTDANCKQPNLKPTQRPQSRCDSRNSKCRMSKSKGCINPHPSCPPCPPCHQSSKKPSKARCCVKPNVDVWNARNSASFDLRCSDGKEYRLCRKDSVTSQDSKICRLGRKKSCSKTKCDSSRRSKCSTRYRECPARKCDQKSNECCEKCCEYRTPPPPRPCSPCSLCTPCSPSPLCSPSPPCSPIPPCSPCPPCPPGPIKSKRPSIEMPCDLKPCPPKSCPPKPCQPKPCPPKPCPPCPVCPEIACPIITPCPATPKASYTRRPLMPCPPPIATPCSNTSIRKKCEEVPRKAEKCTCKKLFKTTVTSWKSGNKCVYCPCCKEDVLPIIKKTRNRMTRHSILSAFLLGCWPICFLCPMQFKRESAYYCPKCRQLIDVGRKDIPCNLRAATPKRSYECC